jgi:hypothetical protein
MTFGFIISLSVLEFCLSKFAPNPRVNSDLHEFDKYIGWKGIPGKEKKYVHGRVDSYVKMNSHGFRDREHNYEKEKDVFRIVVLGDSFTAALQVRLEQTFPYILEEKLNSESRSNKRFEVINLGVIGFGTDQEYLTLKHYGLNYHPDFVILALFLGNDVSDNSFALKGDFRKPYFVLNNGKLEEVPIKKEIPSKDERQIKRGLTAGFQILRGFLTKLVPNIYYYVSDITQEGPSQILGGFLKRFPNTYNSLNDRIYRTPWLENFLGRIGVIKFKPDLPDNYKNEIPDYFHVYLRECRPEWKDAWDVTKSLVVQIAKELEMKKIGFLVVIIPKEVEFQHDIRDKVLVNPKMSTLIDFKKPEHILSNFLEANKIDYLLLRPEFEKYTMETGKRLHYQYRYEPHWNYQGHALTAELI